ncbi:protein translocase subunit SecF [Patescibacteria group bacterium]|nr:protein translocase subunit SecF [Patescibacteria group bacterium]MBU4210348.1 protein translocase subunit SecF [Patescibacteria group bacterium]MBU4264538.1 protein translocase subunit SecF [Patescibacteria group bacterium]MBU4390469.1 protein translocase subunit SecF [Patescibacteria group bacterium]MBU4397385.1 protein translocase subunit SecF [Patescibacteria group bacterium]
MFYLVSLFLLVFSIFSINKWGFKIGLDFGGGTVWEFKSEKIKKEDINNTFEKKGLGLPIISENEGNFVIKSEYIEVDKGRELKDELGDIDEGFEELRFASMGPSLGKELMQKTIMAIALSTLAVLIFVAKRFGDWGFGMAAILAMLHDTVILVGGFSVLGHFFGAELDALFVTAVLTTLSASVHDTVVTFDRVRELRRSDYKSSWVDLANRAVSETLVRSINNSVTIIIMLVSLALLGGESTRWFAVALLIGAVSGTYSSMGVAVPLVLLFKRKS